MELDRDSWRHEVERITMQRDLLLLESSRHKAARETLRQACAELESDLDVMEKERDTARREAERMRDRYEMMEVRGAAPVYSWEREGPTGCGDSPTADVPTGVESGPVGYANRNGTSASEEPYNGAPIRVRCGHCGRSEPCEAVPPQPGDREHLRYLEAMLAAKNKWLKGLPTREEYAALAAKVDALISGFEGASGMMAGDLAALAAKVDAVRDLALHLTDYANARAYGLTGTACLQVVNDSAQKARKA
jgi:hypothetical protein